MWSKWYETFGARVLRCSRRQNFIDEGVERDRSSRVLSCCMTIEPALDRVSLVRICGAIARARSLSYRSEPVQDREHICAGSLCSVNDGSKQVVLLKIKVFKRVK